MNLRKKEIAETEACVSGDEDEERERERASKTKKPIFVSLYSQLWSLGSLGHERLCPRSRCYLAERDKLRKEVHTSAGD